METEKLNIFDENGQHLGVETREQVHLKGDWHETFHCWIVSRKKGEDFIHLQIRSSRKKDFPGLLDITAAGHLLSTESVPNGVREVEEELGIAVEFNDLVPLGVIKDRIHQAGFIDNEHCHNFLYLVDDSRNLEFELQREEVAGMAATKFRDFAKLCRGETEQIMVKGYEVAEGTIKPVDGAIGRKDLVPHSLHYLEQVAERIEQKLERTGH